MLNGMFPDSVDFIGVHPWKEPMENFFFVENLEVDWTITMSLTFKVDQSDLFPAS